jgi:hypothetical protein
MDGHGNYLPLSPRGPEIRLVQIHQQPAGHDEDLIHCSMVRAPRISAVPFVALSYCWGDPKVTTAIYVNNRELQVTVNLEAALREIRKTRALESIWIDALCINQADIAEKEQQIPLMGDIYSSATCVLVWLGRSNREIDMFAWVTRHVPPDLDFDDAAACSSIYAELELDDELVSDMLGDVTVTKPGMRRVCALACLYARFCLQPWWTRLWVLQEQALAKQLVFHCGPHSWDFMLLLRCFHVCVYGLGALEGQGDTEDTRDYLRVMSIAAKSNVVGSETLTLRQDPWDEWLAKKFDPMSYYAAMHSALGEFLELRRVFQLDKSGVTLQEALSRTRDAQATNQRDRVFAIMALLVQEQRSKIKIDYTSPPEVVFRDTIVASWEDWDIPAGLALFTPVSAASLPSWVPDLASPNAATHIHGGDSGHTWITKATIPPPTRIQDRDCIFWRGCPIDSITWSTGVPLDFEAHPDLFVKAVRDIRAEFRRASAIVMPGSDPICFMERLKHRHGVSHIMTLLLTRNPTYTDSDSDFESRLDSALEEEWVADGIAVMRRGRSQHDAIHKFILGRVREQGLSDQTEKAAVEESGAYMRFCMAAQFIASMRERSLGFTFFTTAKGFLGYTKAQVVAGDEIVLMVGMDYPLVLRRQPGDDSWRIMGLAFVSGLMNFKELERRYYNQGKLPLQEFKIG